jgi:pantoate--beta-alanine ligase
MLLLSTLSELKQEASRRKVAAGLGGVVVPTMGALHRGHEALIERGAAVARERGFAEGCAVTIFVNPTQFNDPKDFQRYPRTLEADLEICGRAGASAAFVPEPATIYPPGEPIAVPPLPAEATEPRLEDAFRPGHFAGVCQVVLRLFDLLRPRVAIFGEKDWQQFRVISSMVAQQGLPIEVLGHPTLRDHDGLALSSRNRFLSPEDRSAAAAVPMALCLASSQTDPAAAWALMRRTLTDAGLVVDYAAVRDAASLLAWTPGRPGRALIAARAPGGVRLIDNAPWGP